jgi:hypothetical protein
MQARCMALQLRIGISIHKQARFQVLSYSPPHFFKPKSFSVCEVVTRDCRCCWSKLGSEEERSG